MTAFKAKIQIIGVNPYVLLPQPTLKELFAQAGRDKGPIPVKGTLDGHPYLQHLVKYSGKWRLYLNGPMRKAAGKDVGDTISVTITHDPADRTIAMHPKLQAALKADKAAKTKYDSLPPSRKKEIVRYIANLKSEAAIDKNVQRAINFLHEKERFIGRDKP